MQRINREVVHQHLQDLRMKASAHKQALRSKRKKKRK